MNITQTKHTEPPPLCEGSQVSLWSHLSWLTVPGSNRPGCELLLLQADDTLARKPQDIKHQRFDELFLSEAKRLNSYCAASFTHSIAANNVSHADSNSYRKYYTSNCL